MGRRRRVRVQRGSRVRAQRRALPAPPLVADGVPRPAGRAARDRHRPPGQPRVPRVGRDRPPGRGRAGRLPRHARRDRLAHHDGQRPRRARLRRRRDRGRGRAPWPAAVPADAADRRRPAPRRAAVGGHGDRPRAGRHGDAPRVRGRGRVRGVRGRRPRGPHPRRPGHDLQHEPRVRGDDDAVPDRRRDARVPAADRPHARAGRPRRPVCQDPGPVARAGRRPRVRRPARARPLDRGAVARGSAATPGPHRPRRRGRELPGRVPADRRCRAEAGRRRRADGGARARVGRDRRDHLVHEHVQPGGDGRGGPPCPQRGRPRPSAVTRSSRPRSPRARRRSPGTSSGRG